MAEVILKNVAKRWDNFVAVHNFDLTIEDGEFLVLVGPSGCGKSTTLRMIAGLDDPSEGHILIKGKDVTDLEPKDRDIAMVFQSYALYPHMNIYDNLAFGLKLKKLPKETIDRDVRSVADMLGISPLLERFPKALSGGQRQRVALGRAIVRKPAVFLMDEPLSNLDAKLRVIMRAELIKLHRQLASTFIYVTHDQTEAMTMGTRIVVMKDGIIQQIGAPSEIYRHPINAFVAGFIGSPPMNFINGYVEGAADTARFVSPGLEIPLPLQLCHLTGTCKGGVRLGIRPEDMTFAPCGPDSPKAFKCEVVEHIGANYIIYASHPECGEVVISMTGRNMPPAPGDFIEIGGEKECLHIFDQDTELSLDKPFSA